MKGFTRQEALDLTSISEDFLTLLDEEGVVVPRFIGSPKKLKMTYSADQVVELKIACSLRPRMPLRDVVEVIRFARGSGYYWRVFQVTLAKVNGELMSTYDWATTSGYETFGEKVLEAAKANNGRVTVRDLGVIGDVFTPIWESEAWGKVLDIEKRVTGTILEKT